MNSRINYPVEVENMINEAIHMHLAGEMTYTQMAVTCTQDNIALLGFGEFFRLCGARLRGGVQHLIRMQSVRGGKVNLTSETAIKSLVVVPNIPVQEENVDLKKTMTIFMNQAFEVERRLEECLRKVTKLAMSKEDFGTMGLFENGLIKKHLMMIKALVLINTNLKNGQTDIVGLEKTMMLPLIGKFKECLTYNWFENKFVGNMEWNNKMEGSFPCTPFTMHFIKAFLF